MPYTLIIGNKNYSSWSLRGWLLFRAFDIPCEEQVVPVFTEAFEDYKKRHFPARQVPAMLGGESQIVWDSLAMAETLAERHPDAGIWPADPAARAAARSLCADMHAGFSALRATMPMNLRRTYRSFKPDADTRQDIERITALWSWARSEFGGEGPFLFGSRFCAADAFFTPVATRFKTYGIALDAANQTYNDALLDHPATQVFYREAAEEAWVIERVELDLD